MSVAVWFFVKAISFTLPAALKRLNSLLLGIALVLLSRWTKVLEKALEPCRFGQSGATSLSLESLMFRVAFVEKKRERAFL